MKPPVCRDRARASLVVGFVLALSATGVSAGEDRELRIRYGELIDTAAVTHSGRTVGDELRLARVAQKLAAEAAPKDRAALEAARNARLSLVEPFLESRAFVLDAALVQAEPARAGRPMVEVASL